MYGLYLQIALQFAAKAVKIAPCYYVTGNHEARILEYSGFENGLIELGVVVLENERVELEIAGEAIALLGVHDPSFQSTHYRIQFQYAVRKVSGRTARIGRKN